MPELPEVEALVAFLAGQARGRVVERVEVATFSALKTYDPPLDALHGLALEGAVRRGKYLCLRFGAELWLVLHLSRGGWVQWRDQLAAGRVKAGRGPLALRIRFTDGSGLDVTEMGTEKRLSAWVVHSPDEVEGVARLGPDPLDPAFDAAALARVLAGRSGNLKSVLTDQSALAGVGNAYSDEALHSARLSPFKPAGKLSEDETARLYQALVDVLREAAARSEGLPASGLKGEKKSGLRVHGRTGEPCLVCGDTIREVSFATKSLQYCPRCQTGGKPLADRRLSRLLK
jgi:formamidopyrimidine-DNA glycosylase